MKKKKLTVLEETERQTELMADIEGKIKELNEELTEKRAGLKERLDAANGELDKLNKRRNKAGEVVPKPILGRYEFIRSRLSHPVIVPVEDAVCTGCNIMIPPQDTTCCRKVSRFLAAPTASASSTGSSIFPKLQSLKLFRKTKNSF